MDVTLIQNDRVECSLLIKVGFGCIVQLRARPVHQRLVLAAHAARCAQPGVAGQLDLVGDGPSLLEDGLRNPHGVVHGSCLQANRTEDSHSIMKYKARELYP